MEFINKVLAKFQSTLPREERQFLTYLKRLERLFQSTLPREERQMVHIISMD